MAAEGGKTLFCNASIWQSAGGGKASWMAVEGTRIVALGAPARAIRDHRITLAPGLPVRCCGWLPLSAAGCWLLCCWRGWCGCAVDTGAAGV
jgi:hypothetical protein